MMRPVQMVWPCMALVFAACTDSGSSSKAALNASANASFASYDAGAVPGGPGAQQLYALGHAAADSATTAMNQDIGADGLELPAGSGSVARGVLVYKAQCAQCHGAQGEGLPTFPKLVGRDSAGTPTAEFQFATSNKTKTIGNYWPYATTLFDYIKRAMPFAAPGSMTDDDVYAVTAYLLSANAIIPDTVVLNAATLRAVRMPARDHFVPDNRKPNATMKE